MAAGKRRSDPGYGQGSVTLAADDAMFLDESELTKQLLDTLTSPDYRPPTLPRVAMELMGLARQPDVTFEAVAQLLEQDSLLVGRVMKLVQSPVFRGSSQITSIKDALVRIGLGTLRDVVLDASMRVRVFRCEAYAGAMERLQRHSAMTAHLCRALCRYTAIEGEYSFLCGLLHDVGVAGCLIALSEAGPRDEPPELVAVWPAIERAHSEAGARMTELWSMPAEVQIVLGAHHQVLIDGFAHPLAATVCIAQDLAWERGFGLLPDAGADEDREADAQDREALHDARACERSLTTLDRSSPRTLEQAREALNLTPEQLTLIEAEADRLAEELGA